MINATKEKLSAFFQGNTQFEVPFFQRPYVWKEDNWINFWEHIHAVAVSPMDKKKEHFIGTIITKQQVAERMSEHKHDLIDGQQRLTTVSLLLKAIANTASGIGEFPKLKSKTNELLMFEDSRGKKYMRLVHSKHDDTYFNAVLNDEDLSELPNQEHKILKAYQFFIEKLTNKSDEERDAIKTTVLERVPIISMLLGADDDEQEIFDTINSLGVRLTTGELLKNYIFKDKALQKDFDNLWGKTFEEDEESTLFWERNKTSGRIIRTNIEVLLYCYLIAKTKKEVKLETLFAEYKEYLREKDTTEKGVFLHELKQYASIYEEFPDGADLKEFAYSDVEKRFFHTIENLEINTIYPLILYVYQKIKAKEQRCEILALLESYLVRRSICRRTTKNYNNLFIQIIAQLEEQGEITRNNLFNILVQFDADTNIFPSDDEVKHAFANFNYTNHVSRCFLFTIALKTVDTELSDVRNLTFASFTVEHIMPVKWEEYWTLVEPTVEAKVKRDQHIKSLGNLTLVTGKLNRKMQNAGWVTKREILKGHSRLSITQKYLDSPDWNELLIQQRAKALSELAIECWKHSY